ncbi:MAG: Molybdopterin-binding domain of aldehyde dehydrogenase-domain-containing protein, partial [Olpidium bornovanus]
MLISQCENFSLNESNRSLGKAIPHVAALKQTCGQAQYTDDTPKLAGELYAGLVMSTKPHAKIISVDFSAVLEIPGVHDYVCAKDVPGDNVWAPGRDEEGFATTTVYYHGHVIGAILADDQLTAQEAARLVKVEYEDLPVLLSIEVGLLSCPTGDLFDGATQSPDDVKRQILKGDLDAGFTSAEFILFGEARIGGQEHFYLETQASLAIPSTENGGIEIISSTQNPNETQLVIAHVLGVPAHLVSCRVRRLGGGFGGKETRSVPISAVCAVAARKTGRPVRIMLDRDEDMLLTGQRHPFLGKWKVGFMGTGRVVALDLSVSLLFPAFRRFHCVHTQSLAIYLQLFSNAGWSADLSLPLSTTASEHRFRGFGAPQGMFFTESIICAIADRLAMSAEAVREKMLYQEGDRTHFGMQLTDWHIPAVMNQLRREVGIEERKNAIAEFNAQNRWRKRGYALVPTKFGISFSHLTYNQAGALVHIYTDGSVLLAHGGTEMGQGLHTKMIQVAAETLRVPVESVHIAETSTTTVANASPTAASSSSDLNGMA